MWGSGNGVVAELVKSAAAKQFNCALGSEILNRLLGLAKHYISPSGTYRAAHSAERRMDALT